MKLPEYVHKILNVHQIKPKRVTLRRKGISGFVFRLEGKKDLALKISPRYGLYSEIYFFKKAKGAGFPVPKIIVADTSKRLIPHDFHIAGWIRGEAPDKFRNKNLYDCAYELGRMFAKMHKIHTNGYGFPKPNGKWSHRSWGSALKDFIYKEISSSEIRGLFGKRITDLTRDILFDKKMNIKTPSLIHGDAGLRFLNQIWAATIVYKTEKRNGRVMVEEAVCLAKEFGL